MLSDEMGRRLRGGQGPNKSVPLRPYALFVCPPGGTDQPSERTGNPTDDANTAVRAFLIDVQR